MNKERIFFSILSIFFIFFLILIFAFKNGYYKTSTSKAKTLTEEQIKVFEEDIALGKEIDISEYVVNGVKDYSTLASRSIYKISVSSQKVLDKAIKYLFRKASKVIEE